MDVKAALAHFGLINGSEEEDQEGQFEDDAGGSEGANATADPNAPHE